MGSEMCIRDRADGEHLLLAAGELRAAVVDALGQARESFHDAIDCLLYTSDAADERSSVDLGGRRIIKKKKNLENRGN